jgi:hypothetical protein
MTGIPCAPDRGSDPAGEPVGHPHQVRVIQLLIIAVQPPPPGPEPARVVPQREVGVEHDPVHAVVAARQQIAVWRTEPSLNPSTTAGRSHQLPRQGLAETVD